MKRIIYTIVILAGLALGAANAYPAIRLTNSLAKDINQAYGFYLGQDYSLNEISKKFPSLSGLSRIAEMEFLANFKSSIKGMDSFMLKYNTDDWQKIKRDASQQIASFINIDQLSETQARQFLNLVRQRAKGNIESPIIETLLLFKSGYEENPEREFLDGYKYKYSNNGSGKAKGVAFTIEVPKTWASKEGARPNIVQKFASNNGRGPEYLMILIKDIQLAPGEKISEQDIAEIRKPQAIQNFLPDGSSYIKSGKLTLENLPGFWVHFEMELSRARNTVRMETIMYAVFYNNKMIQIQGQVARAINGETVNAQGLEKYEKLFDLMANSFVIANIYQ